MLRLKFRFGILHVPWALLMLLMFSKASAQRDTVRFDPTADTDPTKPVFMSFRYQHMKLSDLAYNNVYTLRHDRIALKKIEIDSGSGSRGIITRFDLPLVAATHNGETTTGIGDLYAQALVAPRVKSNFFIALGTGLIIPTASESLGREKFIGAPAFVPVLFFPGRGLAFLKFQDWFSFAGSGENDFHYFTITFSTLQRIVKRFWIVADTESNTNWLNDNRTWYKSGLITGYMVSHRVGMWVKGEIPYGHYRVGEWYGTVGIFITRF